MEEFNLLQTILIPVSKLVNNNGQIEGLPKNPRIIKDEKYYKLKKSIEESPYFLFARELLVYELDGKYIVLAGNMRLKVAKEIGMPTIPCKIIPDTYSIDQLKAVVLKDNIIYGENDFDALANEWEYIDLEKNDIDIQLHNEDIDISAFFEDDNSDKEQKNKIVLEYTDEDYQKVIDAFSKHSGSKESIVYKLLGL